jgi:hypothetical protein
MRFLILLGVLFMVLIWHFQGNEAQAKSHAGEALNLLHKLKSYKQVPSLWSPVYTLQDGSKIYITSIYDTDTIRINSPIPEEAVKPMLSTEYIFTCGIHYKVGDPSYWQVKAISTSGVLLWSDSKTNPSTGTGGIAQGLTVDSTGLYVAGEIPDPIDNQYRWTVIKYDFNGNVKWTHKLADKSFAESIKIYKGELFVGGMVYDSEDNTSGYYECLDAKTGNAIWSVATAFPYGEVFNVAIDSDSVYGVTMATGTSVFIEKRSMADGSLIWTQTKLNSFFTEISVDNGAVYILGEDLGSPQKLITEKLFASSGASEWEIEEAYTYSYPQAILAKNGALYTSATREVQINTLRKLTTDSGGIIWEHGLSTADSVYEDMCLNSENNVVAGHYYDVAIINKNTGVLIKNLADTGTYLQIQGIGYINIED